MGIRKNQTNLTKAEWKSFISAVDALHGTSVAAPAYRRFVTLHVDAMSGAVHESKCGNAARVNVKLCGQKNPSAGASG